jgi:2-keto-4-pentenoate hydratase/2-oxohepta-3-ene-1,7-dioic acid hydratase in catechol pathway
MRLGLAAIPGTGEHVPCVVGPHGPVGVAEVLPAQGTGQLTMQALVDRFDDVRDRLERLAATDDPLAEPFRLLPPLPRPRKILCCIANYWEHAQREPRPLRMYLKNPDAVVGPEGTIRLPTLTDPWMFMHEAELAVVIKGPARRVPQAAWREAVFGYTCLIDVSARGEGRQSWRPGSWLGKSFDTFCPLGPFIVTADEVEDPNDLRVRLWDDGQLRHDYTTDDMEHRVPELIEFATTVMTMLSGDIIACGTNHEGLGALQDGETVEIEIQGIGRMSLKVADPLKRTWERGVYMGADSTHPEAVRRHRPRDAGTSSSRPETQSS